MPDTLKSTLFGTEAERALQTLVTRVVDVKNGFDQVVDKAEEDFKPIAQEFCALHAAHLDKLRDALAEYGFDVDDGGSFMSKVNETVVAGRASVDDIDKDIMAQIRSGEQHVLNAFEDAQNKVGDDPLRARLGAMRDELRGLIDQTRDLG